MTELQFKKATKQQAKLRMAIFGPSGAGKTYSALRIATGIGGKIAVIDTERGSASKYSDRFDFDVLELEDASINVYQQAIQAAARGGYNVLIMDSLSHAWQELLVEIDKLASTKFSGNTWAAWSMGTPKQRKFIDAILSYPGHIIATMRVKTEWVEGERNGKKTYTRVGLNPEQGKGIEYEFDLLLELSVEHIGIVAKDRTGKFQDKTIDKPGEDFGRELVAWLSDGSPAPRRAPEEIIEGLGYYPQPAAVAAAVEQGGEVRETKQEQPAAPKPPARTTGSKQRKQFEPKALRNMLLRAAEEKYLNYPCSPEERQAVVGCLNHILGGDAPRKELLKYLTGISSTKELSDAYMLALHGWLKPSYDKNLAAFIATDEISVREAAATHREALLAAGQQELI